LTLLHGNQPSFPEMLARLVEKEADALVRPGRADAIFFCSNKNIAFADVRMSEHVLTLPLASPRVPGMARTPVLP
jgi:hypothetical protein